MAKKSRLSRGLDALYFDNTEENENIETQKTDDNSTEKNNTTYVRLSLIEPNKSQPREDFDDEKLGELADSIRENGVLQPILVRPLENGGYQIVAGERRWRASRLAGLTEVPVFIRELDDKQTMQIALIENIQRQDLSPLEESQAYQKLMDTYGMTQQEVAKAVGKSRSVIANSLRLQKLPSEVKGMLNDGKLTVGHAKILAGIDNEEELLNAARECADRSMTVRELELYASKLHYENTEEKLKKAVKKNSFKQENPYFREFEIFMNTNSSVKTKIHPCRNGDAKVEFVFQKGTDFESVLNQIAELLAESKE